MKVKDIYPLTIIADRYEGVYSRGKYLAFNKHHWAIPDKIGGSDGDEMEFWGGPEHNEYLIGKGNTPQQAVENLTQLLNSIMT